MFFSLPVLSQVPSPFPAVCRLWASFLRGDSRLGWKHKLSARLSSLDFVSATSTTTVKVMLEPGGFKEREKRREGETERDRGRDRGSE